MYNVVLRQDVHIILFGFFGFVCFHSRGCLCVINCTFPRNTSLSASCTTSSYNNNVAGWHRTHLQAQEETPNLVIGEPAEGVVMMSSEWGELGNFSRLMYKLPAGMQPIGQLHNWRLDANRKAELWGPAASCVRLTCAEAPEPLPAGSGLGSLPECSQRPWDACAIFTLISMTCAQANFFQCLIAERVEADWKW